ncbi:MAG: glycerol kinase GlpK [Lachnospiraceae bacterium]|nr:glycerol kinase GlpK [Lachnospiraceae bacterium]
MEKYILAFDAGTTSNRCIVFNKEGRIISVAQKEFTQIFPKPGWVEHDPEEIWSTQIGVAVEAVAKSGISPESIAAIGITNQRETTIVWDKITGKPVYNAIVWQCRRTADFCERISDKKELIRQKTGLVLDPYFSATKVKWILDNVDGAREKAEEGRLLFGTVETWLIWKLTGGKVHVTDYSNASRTMLFNINTLKWDENILKMFNIPANMLPEVRPNSEIYGYALERFFGAAVPIAGAAGDQQAALFGQNCFKSGQAKNTYGTGCFLLMNIGEKPIITDTGLVTTIAWNIGGEVTYALEGSVFVGGASVQWLRDEMGLIKDAADSEVVANKVPNTNGIYVVPAFTGMGAPYWDPYARGVIVGITRGTNKKHIVRATLESIAYQVNDVLGVMKDASGMPIESLHVDGGASRNNLIMQMQADISDMPVVRPMCVETTALGAAYLAGLAVGYWDSTAEIEKNAIIDREFVPVITPGERSEKLSGWKKAVVHSFGWAK